MIITMTETNSYMDYTNYSHSSWVGTRVSAVSIFLRKWQCVLILHCTEIYISHQMDVTVMPNYCRQISNIWCTLLGNDIIDHDDVVGAMRTTKISWSITCPHCSNYISIPDFTHGFNGLDKDNCKTRWDTFKCWDLLCLILEVEWYLTQPKYSLSQLSNDLVMSISIPEQYCGTQMSQNVNRQEAICLLILWYLIDKPTEELVKIWKINNKRLNKQR